MRRDYRKALHPCQRWPRALNAKQARGHFRAPGCCLRGIPMHRDATAYAWVAKGLPRTPLAVTRSAQSR